MIIFFREVPYRSPSRSELIALTCIFVFHLYGKTERVVPESIGFHLITGPFSNRPTVYIGIHPSQCRPVLLSPQQAVRLQRDLLSMAGSITFYDILHDPAVFLPDFLLRSSGLNVGLKYRDKHQRRLNLSRTGIEAFLIVSYKIVENLLEFIELAGADCKTRKREKSLSQKAGI